MYTITKQFDFCYGHRVWSQILNTEFSLDSCLACRHLHGHQAKVIVHLQADTLSEGMVTDFKHLNWFKKWLDDVLDHKFIMDASDPLLSSEISILFNWTTDHFETGVNSDNWERKDGYWVVRPSAYHNLLPYLKEKYEGFVIVDFVPTSENLSKWLFDIVTAKMKPLGIKVSRVEFFETPKSRSMYTEDGI